MNWRRTVWVNRVSVELSWDPVARNKTHGESRGGDKDLESLLWEDGGRETLRSNNEALGTKATHSSLRQSREMLSWHSSSDYSPFPLLLLFNKISSLANSDTFSWSSNWFLIDASPHSHIPLFSSDFQISSLSCGKEEMLFFPPRKWRSHRIHE